MNMIPQPIKSPKTPRKDVKGCHLLYDKVPLETPNDHVYDKVADETSYEQLYDQVPLETPNDHVYDKVADETSYEQLYVLTDSEFTYSSSESPYLLGPILPERNSTFQDCKSSTSHVMESENTQSPPMPFYSSEQIDNHIEQSGLDKNTFHGTFANYAVDKILKKIGYKGKSRKVCILIGESKHGRPIAKIMSQYLKNHDNKVEEKDIGVTNPEPKKQPSLFESMKKKVNKKKKPMGTTDNPYDLLIVCSEENISLSEYEARNYISLFYGHNVPLEKNDAGKYVFMPGNREQALKSKIIQYSTDVQRITIYDSACPVSKKHNKK